MLREFHGKEARLSLLSEDPGWFHALRRDYDLPEIRFDPEDIAELVDADGQPLPDIRNRAENDRAADQIVDLLRNLTSDPDAALHVFIAGGRKTMGYYLGYALSLFGRPQDRLSHVLSLPRLRGQPRVLLSDALFARHLYRRR